MGESILIVGGYGVVGSRIAADLASDFPGRVVVAGRHLDRAEAAAVAIGHGARGADDLSGPGSLDYLLQELTMRFSVYVDGVDRPARPFTSPRVVGYPAPVGPRRAYVFPFSDQVLYPRTMGARTVVTRLSVDPSRTSRLLALLVHTGGTRLVALPRVRAALGPLHQHGPAALPTAPYALRVDVANGGNTAYATLAGFGQAYATATGTAALVRSLADGEVGQAGAWMPEQVIDPPRFFDRLARRGLHVTTSVAPDNASLRDRARERG